MDTDSLKTFITLANTKNFTRTANQLFIAQSTVTNRIMELEKEVDAVLLNRTNRKVELTREGEYFLLSASRILETMEKTLSNIHSMNKYDNYLRIAAADSIYEGHLTQYLLHHQREFPNDSIKITIGLSGHLLEQLQDDLYDVVFSYLPLNNSSHIHCEIFKQDSLVLVTDSSNDNFSDGIKKEELVKLDEKYIMCNFALQDIGEFIRNLFPHYHQFSLEIDDCSKIIPFLSNQEKYTFLPEDMAKPYIKKGLLRMVSLLDLQVPVINSYMICKKEKEELCHKIFK